MQDSRIGRRYAQALFDAAKRVEAVRPVESDLDALASLYLNDVNFRELLILPNLSREEKVAKLESLFADRATALTLQVLRIVVEKGRESELPAIRDEYVKLRRSDEGVVYASVVSAAPLPPEQKDAVVSKVSGALGKSVEADFQVDPHLIGGVLVQYDNYVLDGSVRGALDRMKERLRKDVLKQA
jgi:F-type H+-transporting ATPase subunit delta